MPRNAFVFRNNAHQPDSMQVALDHDRVFIGWAHIPGLLNADLGYHEFREIVHAQGFHEDSNYVRSGKAAGHLWRFLHEMERGDLVVVPRAREFFVGEVSDDNAAFDPTQVDFDRAYYRKINWLNEKKPIPRHQATAALSARMKVWKLGANAGDLVQDIEQCLQDASAGVERTFDSELRRILEDSTREQLKRGYVNERRFEELIANLMLRQGAVEAAVTPRRIDKGIDILARFPIAGFFQANVAIQAKFYPDGAVTKDAVDQLLAGISESEEDIAIALIITNGEIDPSTEKYAADRSAEGAHYVRFVDGELLARMVVEAGFSNMG